MNNRATSIEMFHKAKASGYLTEKRLLVYEILCRHSHDYGLNQQGMTASEMEHMAGVIFSLPPSKTKHLHKRLSELERQGVARVLGSRECRVTGNQSIQWQITGELPTSKMQPATKFITKGQAVAIDFLRRLWEAYEGGSELTTKPMTIGGDLEWDEKSGSQVSVVFKPNKDGKWRVTEYRPKEELDQMWQEAVDKIKAII